MTEQQKMDHPEETKNFILDFAELDALEAVEQEKAHLAKRAKQFLSMLANVQTFDELQNLRSGMSRAVRRNRKEITKAAPMKTEGGTSYPKADFAYTPSDEVSTWKLRLAEGRPGNITRKQLGAAAAALSPGGFRGNRVELPSDAVSKVKARIRAEYEKLGIDRADMPASVKELAEIIQDDTELNTLKERGKFQLWKEGDSLRWLAVYSNKFRDNDNPPEIISEASHKNFVEMVDKGQAQYPELWYWHIPGTRFGVADYVAYDDSGFAIASGTIDKDKEDIAQNVAKTPDQLMSHGMPNIHIRRNKGDNSIIENHISTEISVLPREAAANKLTNFIMEEKNMSLPDEKAKVLQGLGFDVGAIEQGLEAKAQGAIDNGVEFKEETQAAAIEVAEEAIPQPEQPRVDYVTKVEMLSLIETMASDMQTLSDEIHALKQAQVSEVEKQLEMTPAASLTAMWQSAIGSEEAKVDGRTTLAKAGPEETQAPQQGMPGIPTLISQLVQNSHNGWKS